jgi:hypothetical protein
MKRSAFLILLFVMIMGGLMGNALAFADADTIKERMKARLPEIISLKNQGVIGENNKGFLEFVGSARPNPALVADENKDRLAVYEAIAKQSGATAQVVGERRAIQITEGADAGDWLQDAGGKWFQK